MPVLASQGVAPHPSCTLLILVFPTQLTQDEPLHRSISPLHWLLAYESFGKKSAFIPALIIWYAIYPFSGVLKMSYGVYLGSDTHCTILCLCCRP